MSAAIERPSGAPELSWASGRSSGQWKAEEQQKQKSGKVESKRQKVEAPEEAEIIAEEWGRFLG